MKRRTVPERPPLHLRRIDVDYWLLEDHTFAVSDPRYFVAGLRASDDRDEITVQWLLAGIPLPTWYRDTADVQDDLERWRNGRTGHSRPIEIPHFEPPKRR